MLVFILGMIVGAIVMDFAYFRKIKCGFKKNLSECIRGYLEYIKHFFHNKF